MAHTPGPWHRNIKPARHYPCIFADHNTHVTRLAGDGLSDEEIEGNCNLIAAAPDLLAALQAILDEECAGFCEFCHRHGPKEDDGTLTGPVNHHKDCPIPQARAAIAKATRE